MSDIEIEIDGKTLTAKPNSMVIQVADEAGIYIPRFCYHKHLSIAANCRMCLVEVEKSPKPLPACATPVMPGMKVFTRSPKALAAQKAVMEFLLINHPLDCPICDQGGECELQDLSMGYGSAESYYSEGKRSIKDKDIGPLVETEMTRCIQCTRCVRFGREIAGLSELGATGRGEHMEIGTYVEQSLRSEVSGNIIDLCPVGALTSKPFRFTARAWELNQYPSIAPHDCVGSNIYVHTRQGTTMRVVPRENRALNETWISDRDRFSYEGLYHSDRLTKPRIRIDDRWQETSWETALEYAVSGLQRVLLTQGAEQLGALLSPNTTLEESYLLQKLVRQLGSSNIDHRLRQVDFSDQHDMPVFPGLNAGLAEIENCDVILLIGSNLQKEQPMIAHRVRKATRHGARVIAVNMMDYHFHFDIAAKKITAPHYFVNALAEIANTLKKNRDHSISNLLREGKKVAVLMGAQALNHPKASEIRSLAKSIANESHAMLGLLTDGANSAGAWLAGAVPHRKPGGEKMAQPGLDVQAMWKKSLKAYLLLNVEPDVDCANSHIAQHALEQAEFVVSLSMFNHPVIAQYANVILPIAPFTETSGTFVNVAGEWQTFKGVATPFGESRPAWKVLRVMGNLFHCEGFDYTSTEAVYEELKSRVGELPVMSYELIGEPKSTDQIHEGLSRIGDVPLYATDSLVRRAKALQATQKIIEGHLTAARMHSDTATALQLKETDVVIVKQQENRVRLPVIIDDRVPEQAVFIASGLSETSHLNELFGSLEIQKI